jgi:hypothetical protein
MLGDYGKKHTLRIRDTYCFSKATVVTPKYHVVSHDGVTVTHCITGNTRIVLCVILKERINKFPADVRPVALWAHLM